MRYTDYYVIQGWMVSGLHLKGINLTVYAIIYSFSRDHESSFKGSLTYLQGMTSVSRPTLIKALTELVELNYIIKSSKYYNNIKLNSYRVSLQVVKKFNGGSKETLQGGGKETLHNKYKEYNNKRKEKDKKEKRIQRKTLPKTKIDSFYFEYSFFTSEFSLIWFNEFLPLKKAKKASITERALKAQLKKIDAYSNSNNDIALQILERSVNGGWSDFYPLGKETPIKKKFGSGLSKGNSYDTYQEIKD